MSSSSLVSSSCSSLSSYSHLDPSQGITKRSLKLEVTPLTEEQKKLERLANQTIGKLAAQEGELLKETSIFRIPSNGAKITKLKQEAPEHFQSNDPHFLACLLKSMFSSDSNLSSGKIPFLPWFFSLKRFDQLTKTVEENPEKAKQELASLFSQQSSCVKNFFLLLKKTSEFEMYNQMGIKKLARMIQPFLMAPFSIEEQLQRSDTLATFMIEHAEEIFPEASIPLVEGEALEKPAPLPRIDLPTRKRLENSIQAIIDRLNANDGELLKGKDIFWISANPSELNALQEALPENFDEITDADLLACLLKRLFHQRIQDDPERRMRFLPNSFTLDHLNILTDNLHKNPDWVKKVLHRLFSRQHETVKNFLLLLHKTSRLKEFNAMGVVQLSRSIQPLLYSHFSNQELIDSSSALAEFIIEHAQAIFAEPGEASSELLQSSQAGGIISFKPLEEESLDPALAYHNWFMDHIRKDKRAVDLLSDAYINPTEALDKISQTIALIPHIDSYTQKKNQLIQMIDLMRLEMLELDRIDEDDRAISEQMTAMKKTLQFFQGTIDKKKNLGASLNRELNQIIEQDRSDTTTALLKLRATYQQINTHLKQVTTDLWRNVMTLVTPNGEELLLALSTTCSENWQSINYKLDPSPDKPPIIDFGYGALATARDTKLPQDLSITDIAWHVTSLLDRYLTQLGISAHHKKEIYNNFQQAAAASANPAITEKELWEKAKQKSSTPFKSEEERISHLEARYQAYTLAHWNAGLLAPCPSPSCYGSEFSTEGFNSYANSKSGEDYGTLGKVFFITLDLQARSIFSHYMFQFQHIESKRIETRYYHHIYQYESSTPSTEKLPPEAFPNLQKIRKLPKFVLHDQINSSKGKEEEK